MSSYLRRMVASRALLLPIPPLEMPAISSPLASLGFGSARTFTSSSSSSGEPAPAANTTSQATYIPGVPQPSPFTHDQATFASQQELNPLITADEFARRRQALYAIMPPYSVIVAMSANIQYVAGVIPRHWRQSADMRYLTGVDAPGAVAIFEAPSHGHSGRFTLFHPPDDADGFRWNGTALGDRACIEFFGADNAVSTGSSGDVHATSITAAAAARGGSVMLCPEARHAMALAANVDAYAPSSSAGATTSHARRLVRAAVAGAGGVARVGGCEQLVHRLRWKKSHAEVELLRRSSAVASRGVAAAAAALATGQPPDERVVASSFEHACKTRGADLLAYPTVCGAGYRAASVHYGRNDARILPHEATLIDAGCEYHGYVSDITRTFPPPRMDAGSRLTFTRAQRRVYDAVRRVHKTCLSMLGPGALLRDVHQHSVAALAAELDALGLPFATSGRAPSAQAPLRRSAYPHSIGHWIGLDTHDSASMPHSEPLVPGVCLTIEPGLYLDDVSVPGGVFADDECFFGDAATAQAAHAAGWPAARGGPRGVGVRLEDVIVITEDGYDVLTRSLPIDADEVEEWMLGLWRGGGAEEAYFPKDGPPAHLPASLS